MITKSKIVYLYVFLFLFSILTPIVVSGHTEYNKDLPSYVKWGKVAVTETKEKYPDSDVIDYLHIGREEKGKTNIEKFKLILKTNDKETGVIVSVEFDKRTERLASVQFQEVQA